MTVLKLITAALGSAFLLFGYLIRFKKKYHLINGFEADLREGRRDEKYAERVGAAELIIGLVLLIAALILVLAV